MKEGIYDRIIRKSDGTIWKVVREFGGHSLKIQRWQSTGVIHFHLTQQPKLYFEEDIIDRSKFQSGEFTVIFPIIKD